MRLETQPLTSEYTSGTRGVRAPLPDPAQMRMAPIRPFERILERPELPSCRGAGAALSRR
jgi:hypothetical protein